MKDDTKDLHFSITRNSSKLDHILKLYKSRKSGYPGHIKSIPPKQRPEGLVHTDFLSCVFLHGIHILLFPIRKRCGTIFVRKQPCKMFILDNFFNLSNIGFPVKYIKQFPSSGSSFRGQFAIQECGKLEKPACKSCSRGKEIYILTVHGHPFSRLPFISQSGEWLQRVS